jgi:hypothetical protein
LENENVYVGHTTNWTQRKRGHKSVCNNSKSKKYDFSLYQKIRENGGWDEWSMVWLEDYPCGGQPEACARERYWIEHYKTNLNIQVPGRTREQWIQYNQEKIREDKREYYKKNTERFKEYREDNAEKFKERSKKYYQNNKEKHQKYNQDHKEEISERGKKHRQINAEIIKQKACEKNTCDKCGSIVSHTHLSRHKKSIKCMNFTPQ